MKQFRFICCCWFIVTVISAASFSEPPPAVSSPINRDVDIRDQQERLEAKISQLMSALKFPTNVEIPVEYMAVFPDDNPVVRFGRYQIKKGSKDEHGEESVSTTHIEILDPDNKIVAAGYVVEAASQRDTLKALARFLVRAVALPIEAMTSKYELRKYDFGDLCIISKRYDKGKKEIVADLSEIIVIRGSKAAILRAVQEDQEVLTIAKELDALFIGLAKTSFSIDRNLPGICLIAASLVSNNEILQADQFGRYPRPSEDRGLRF
jgi:hypothetical protein